MKFNNVYPWYKNILLFAALTLVVGSAILPIRASAQIIVIPAKSDLKVQIVIQTAPGVYQQVNVPSGTVVSAPPSPPSIINCPATAGVAIPTTTDCSEIGLASNTSIKLVAPAALVPNAQFFQWKDIPGYSGLAISSSCTSSTSPPNIACTMAGARNIMAIYKCKDTFSYDSHSKQCKPTQTACVVFMPGRTSCGLDLQIKRAKVGTNTYQVAVSPAAILPSVNTPPNSPSICVNTGSSSVLQTNCAYFYSNSPTTVTLTASSSSGSLPIGFSWSGASSCSGSSPTCTVSVTNANVPVNAVANFPQ